MTLSQLKNKFSNRLKSIYPLSEITSIFRLLAKYRLDLDAAEIVLENQEELIEHDLMFFEKALKRLQEKEPVQYIIGETNFNNLIFKVTPDVLIPRPETEEFVDWILKDIQTQRSKNKLKILDIGTGSGCIAISIANKVKNAEVYALEFSTKAIQIAKENALNNKVAIEFLQENILNIGSLPQDYDIIVSNPPYIRNQEKAQMHDNVLKFEPEEALFVFDDNALLFYDKIGDLAKKHLLEKGSLYFEINQYLGKETTNLLMLKGFSNIEIRKDFLGNDRMIKAQI